MSEFGYPEYATADSDEVLVWLAGKGIAASCRGGDALYLSVSVTKAALDAAFVGYVPTIPQGTYRRPLPGDLPTHVAHLAAIRTATTQQLAAMTDAQVRHALQDVCKALALLIDDRLG